MPIQQRNAILSFAQMEPCTATALGAVHLAVPSSLSTRTLGRDGRDGHSESSRSRWRTPDMWRGFCISIGAKLHRRSWRSARKSRTSVSCNEGRNDLPHYFPKTIDSSKADDSLDEDAASGDDAICELIGYDMGESLSTEISEPFTEEELHAAYVASGYYSAKRARKKAAMWLIGPSACGKSTLAPKAAQWTGMDVEGYVTIDGEVFRDAHHGYQNAITEGQQHGCVWWNAYLGIRENINEEKQLLLERARNDGKHLMIPSTCLRRSQCVDVAEDLVQAGYEIHIVGVFGNKATIVERGQKRAMNAGKRYDPREFELALQMFAPMLRLCTGTWRMVCTTDDASSQKDIHGEAPLEEADIERICKDVFSMYEEADVAC